MIMKISDHALDKYLRKLVKVGYIERTTTNTSSVKRVDSEYRVITKLGVVAPVINDTKYLYDPNTKLQYSLETGEIVSDKEHGNQCLIYSLSLGKEYNFLAGFKNRYKDAHPELVSVEDWYEHAKKLIKRNDILVYKLKKIKKSLGKTRDLRAFSRKLTDMGIFNTYEVFESGIRRMTADKERMLMHEDILKKYESAVAVYEELYGSIILGKEMA